MIWPISWDNIGQICDLIHWIRGLEGMALGLDCVLKWWGKPHCPHPLAVCTQKCAQQVLSEMPQWRLRINLWILFTDWVCACMAAILECMGSFVGARISAQIWLRRRNPSFWFWVQESMKMRVFTMYMYIYRERIGSKRKSLSNKAYKCEIGSQVLCKCVYMMLNVARKCFSK